MISVLRRAPFLLWVALPLWFVLGCARTATTPPSPSPKPSATRDAAPAPAAQGRTAEDFTLTTTEGKEIRLADLKGQPVVVNFWASWCHYCAQEAPDLEALYQQYHPKGLAVLGVGTDDAKSLQAKAKELGLTYPVGSGPETAQRYGVDGVPHTVFVNRDGWITASLVGARPKAELEAEVKKIM
jgi:cytochrome c biogenesis protein CcmG/thiol:disulfide interchange protein DsbE